ncbi:O-antigen ligase [Bradyrhizobium sp. LB1.3]
MNYLRFGARPGRPSSQSIFIGATLALYVAANAMFVIAYGLMGIQGNSVITGGYLITCEMALLYLTFRPVRPQVTDNLFCLFLLSAALSFLINGRTASAKDTTLFVIALGAYPSLRCLSFTQPRMQQSFILVTASIVALGTILTAYAMVTQWGGPYVRPLVLGVNDAAATFFLMACGLLIVGVTATGLDRQKSLLLSAFVFLPGFVFSASLVRATFMAIIATLVLNLVLAEAKQRMHFAVVIGVFLVAIVLGLAPRHLFTNGAAKTSAEMLGPAETVTSAEMAPIKIVAPAQIEMPTFSGPVYPGRKKKDVTAETLGNPPPSCTANVNMGDSIAIREALVQDALWLLSAAGLFGFGFGSFVSMTCLETEVHNSYLQALVEFGWISGVCVCAALVITLYRLIPHYRSNDGARFAISGLTYVAILSAAHGILSEDRLLFAMLGLAASTCDTLTRGAGGAES